VQRIGHYRHAVGKEATNELDDRETEIQEKSEPKIPYSAMVMVVPHAVKLVGSKEFLNTRKVKYEQGLISHFDSFVTLQTPRAF